MFKKAYILYFLIAFLFVSCDKTTEPTVSSPKTLVSGTSVSQFTKTDFINRVKSLFGGNAAQVSLFVQSGVKQYKIVYNTTTPEGNPIKASGALIVPTDFKEALALASYQHGTIFSDAEAPSYFNVASESSVGAFLASTGFIMAMPDYLGYGESKSYPHPYEHAKGLSQANADFLLAVKEFIKAEKINWNNNLLLAGYSEGGYATLATQKLLEEKYASDFTIKASSIGAGAYNKTGTFENFLKFKTSGDVVNNRSYIWVLLTYDRLSKINRPLTEYFIEPYAADIAKNGYNVTINKSIDEILQPKFKTGILNKTDAVWVAALKENDLLDWKVKTPTKFFHGDKDNYVPILNSETTVSNLKAKGSANISFEKIADGTHGSSVNQYYLGTLDFFNANKN
jgi:pimeloyl-ACP methyl ester carboxylesterase